MDAGVPGVRVRVAGISARARLPKVTPRYRFAGAPVREMEKTRAAYFSPAEQQLIMETYEEVKHLICKKGNTAAVIKQREKAWQTIADRLNATNKTGQHRSWQQVKIKYKNILQAVKKKAQLCGTGGKPAPDITPAEESALAINRGRPVIEGIRGGTATDSVPPAEAAIFIHVSGDTVTLLPPDEDPGQGTSAIWDGAAADDEETVSLDSRKPEEPDAVPPDGEPGSINSQTVRCLYTKHLTKQIELAEAQIAVSKKSLQDLDLGIEIKKRTLRKLELEIKILEKELG
ncbi:uncharacterized protein AB9W97_004681 isoform 2-T2 [Spinachia spinachia]